MPQHHFTTPRVTYVGLAHGDKEPREGRAATRVGPSATRPERGQIARRAPTASPRTASR